MATTKQDPPSHPIAGNLEVTVPWRAFFTNISRYVAAAGAGTVSGPATSTDNAIVRWNGTTGTAIQNSGITIADGASGTLSGTNTGNQNLFETIAVSGQSNVVADGPTDTLTLAAGTGVTITTNAGTDTVTIAATGSGGTVTAVTGTSPIASSGGATPDISLNNAGVTLAKIQNAAANSKLVGSGASGSGASYVEIGLGGGLAMTGTTLDTTASGGGGLTLLEQHTGAASASLVFTTAFTSTYDDYLIEIVDISLDTNAQHLWMRCSTDGGSTYDSGANYTWFGHRFNQTGAAFESVVNANQIVVDCTSGDSVSNGTGAALTTSFTWANPLGTVHYKAFSATVTYRSQALSNLGGSVVFGQYQNTAAVDALEFKSSSGNITGTIRIYGKEK